jgi:hypothetical protein
MKITFAVVLVSVAALTTAAPAVLEDRAPIPQAACKPATYSCAKNPGTGVDGWQVCNVGGVWVVSTISIQHAETSVSYKVMLTTV